MKIFTYSASYRDNSNTQKIIKYIVENIEKKENVIWFNHTAENDKISQCKGCENCFRNGNCLLDENDDMKKIKQEMLDADIIMLGSPVYSAMVSGNMKILIDRLSYYLHTLQLRGKIIVPVLSASGNSLLETNNYFKKIVESWGGIVPFSILFTVDAPNMLDSKSFMEHIVPKYVDEIREYGTYIKKKSVSEYQERYFANLKHLYSIPSENAEYAYWKESGMLNFKNFQEVIDRMQ